LKWKAVFTRNTQMLRTDRILETNSASLINSAEDEEMNIIEYNKHLRMRA